MKKTLTVRDAARELGCTLKYVYDLMYAGKLAGAQKRGRVWEIPVTSLHAWRRKQETKVGIVPMPNEQSQR